ncbi:sensor protein CitS [Ruminiclostridium hungatei]|uniref:Sensor protein CitS n=1 Tax=Ruminiclostridium hungatei TaxID=48256 RepID=A0A1V4SRP5_RUMHU|nr:GHKL domain-containing protein [Ruminiclostridium hungatei]OPX45961.1 sensor protein CitS [Ruminiclostridium hungatei]
MTFDNVVFYIILAITFVLSFENITQKHLILKNKLILSGILFFSVTISRFTSDFLNLFIIIVTFLAVDIVKNRNSKLWSIFNVFLVLFTYFIVDAVVRNLCVIFLGSDNAQGRLFQYSYYIFGALITVLFSKTLGKVIKTDYWESNTKDIRKYIIIGNVIFSFIIASVSIVVNKALNVTDTRIYIVNIAIFLAYIISSIFTLTIFNRFVVKEAELSIREVEMKKIEEYTRTIEDLYNSIRKFKHDYKNILISMNEYIEGKRYAELEEYFRDNILKTESFVTSNDYAIKLANLKIPSLKALICSKLIHASNNQINVFTDIRENIEDIPINIIDAIRVLGNLLDNAIEEAIYTDEKRLNFGAVYKGNSLIFIVENTCRPSTPPVFKVVEKGFSSKGPGRGLGLVNIKGIINSYENCTLNIEIDNGSFKAEVWMRIIS